MDYPRPLIRATLVQRYKRFLADVKLENGETVTAHCANPGSMAGLKDPGLTVWLEPNDNPKRKLRYSWELAELPDGNLVCVNTAMANKIVAEALHARKIPALAPYPDIRPEVKYGQSSRIDFLLRAKDLPDCYLEVKSVTLSRRPGLAEFPDSVTKRGTKHLQELAAMVAAGQRAMMLYLVQHSGAQRFTLARDIDPAYAEAFAKARAAGVEVLCYATDLSHKGQSLARELPLDI